MTAPNIDRSAPLLSVDEWRQQMGFNPWHFWGLANTRVPVTSACNTLTFEYAWQNVDAVGRSEIADAIALAERKLKAYLGYAPAPQFESDEIQFPQYFDVRNQYLSSADALGRWLSVQLQSQRVKTVGVLSRALIGNANVTYSDLDSDNLDETFTVSIATTVTDPEQIAVYFTATDRYDGTGVSERWRVRPVDVSISGGTVTITGRAWTIVRPVLYQGVARTAIDPDTVGNFVTQLAVYRRSVDTTQQGEFIWETAPGAGCANDATTMNEADPAGYAEASARYVVRNADLGHVAGETAEYDSTLGEWVAVDWPYGYAPQKLRVNYLAGHPNEDDGIDGAGRMAEHMRRIVARLAAAEIARPVCGCDVANRELSRWQFDLARNAGAADEAYQLSFEDMQNPFGTRRGQVAAWKDIRQLMHQTAIVV
jgi:hypothetical protein